MGHGSRYFFMRLFYNSLGIALFSRKKNNDKKSMRLTCVDELYRSTGDKLKVGQICPTKKNRLRLFPEYRKFLNFPSLYIIVIFPIKGGPKSGANGQK